MRTGFAGGGGGLDRTLPDASLCSFRDDCGGGGGGCFCVLASSVVCVVSATDSVDTVLDLRSPNGGGCGGFLASLAELVVSDVDDGSLATSTITLVPSSTLGGGSGGFGFSSSLEDAAVCCLDSLVELLFVLGGGGGGILARELVVFESRIDDLCVDSTGGLAGGAGLSFPLERSSSDDFDDEAEEARLSVEACVCALVDLL